MHLSASEDFDSPSFRLCLGLIANMFLYLIVVAAAVTSVEAASKVLLVSMDGFRWDYTQKWHTPNFDKMAQQGTKAPYLTSTFNTKTFPSHYSIATGIYLGIEFYLFVSHEGMKRQRFHV